MACLTGSNHAEVNAILNAESKFKDSTKDVLDGSTLFVTLEPCSTEKGRRLAQI